MPPQSRDRSAPSSFAVALRESTFIRPRIAIAISAATLIAALVTGGMLLRALRSSGVSVSRDGRGAAALHGYNTALELWRQEAEAGDPGLQRADARELRDSIRAALTVQFREWRAEQTDSSRRALVEMVLESLREQNVGLTLEARRAMVVLLTRQDAALVAAAEGAQETVLYAAILLGLTVIAVGTLIVPMARLYLHHRRDGTFAWEAELTPEEARR